VIHRSCLVIAAALVVACSGSDGPAGDPGAAGNPSTAGTTPASLNQIAPRVGLIGRKVTVRLTFDGAPSSAPKVTFGKLTVSKTTVDGSSVLVDLDIKDTDALGPQDVTVDGQTSKSAFVVAAPLDVKVAAGKAEQGGLVQLDVANEDPRAFFDTQNFTLIPNTASASDGTLVQLTSTGLTATDGSIILVGDPLAKTGALGFLGVNNPQDAMSTTFLSAPDAVAVGARDPEALTAGTPSQKTLANPLETAFYTITATPSAGEGLLVDAHAIAPAGSQIQSLVLGYGPGGTIADLLDQKKDDPGFPGFIPPTEARIAYPVVGAASKAFFVVLDSSLKNSSQTKLTFDYETYRATLVAEVGTAHPDATPQDLGTLPALSATPPALVVQGELKTASEIDTYSFAGLSAGSAVDIQVSIAPANPSIGVLVDTVNTYDSMDVVQIQAGGKVGSATTVNMTGASRFIQVSGAAGKYSLGIRRAN
jgi:hypothetical protein